MLDNHGPHAQTTWSASSVAGHLAGSVRTAALDGHAVAIRARRPADQLRTRLARLLHQHLHRARGVQHGRAGLEQDPAQVAAAERREQALGLGRLEPLDRDPLVAQHAFALGLPAVVAVGEPREAVRLDERRVDLAPERRRAARGLRVPALRSVREAQEPRLAAGRRSGPARRFLLDDRHVPVVQRQPARHCRAEHA